jgi:hypothetical protein
MKTRYLFGFALYAVLTIPGSVNSSQCSCIDMLQELIERIEQSYIGYHLEVLHNRDLEYEEHKQTFLKNTIDVLSTGPKCARIIQHFLNFFDDGHLFVYETNNYTEDELTQFERQREVEKNNLSSSHMQEPVDFRTDIQGNWTDGTAEYIIFEKNGMLHGYVETSGKPGIEPGQLKMRLNQTGNVYEGLLYQANGAPRYVFGNIYKEGTLLRLSGGIIWARMESSFKREVLSHDLDNPHMPKIELLDDEAVLFSIPSFLVDGNEFVKYLLAHKEILYNARYLIIDVRGNTGGNALYSSFMSLFANKKPDENQGLVLASPYTLEYYVHLAKMTPELYQPVVDRIKNNMGEIVDGPKYPGRSFEPLPVNIEQVAILADRGSMSASESFILSAKSISSKVTIFGEPTGGVIDYTNIHMISLSCSEPEIMFGYPTSTLHKSIPDNGYNKTGILPDVRLDESNSDKVETILKTLKEQTRKQVETSSKSSMRTKY